MCGRINRARFAMPREHGLHKVLFWEYLIVENLEFEIKTIGYQNLEFEIKTSGYQNESFGNEHTSSISPLLAAGR